MTPKPNSDITSISEWDTKETKALVERIRASAAFRHAPQRLAVLNLLVAQRGKHSRAIDIWDEALYEHSRSKDKDDETFIREHGYEKSVRAVAHDLRCVLEDHFRDVREGQIIHLDNAIPSQGYRLEISTKRDKSKATWRFWQPHLDDSLDICVVYVEQLFYRALNELLVFRYYDCNAEHSDEAKEVLKAAHPEVHKAYENQLRPVFPYVAWGELEARDLIKKWFSENATIDVQSIIPRRMRPETSLWDGSLILLGSTFGNAMIQEVLKKYQPYPSNGGSRRVGRSRCHQ